MSKIIIIGIDAFDPFLLMKWKDLLPNIGRLYKDESELIIQSTFPPDSICAWTSIFTGVNPAEHGIIESIDYLSSRKISEGVDRVSYIRGKTFWDLAGKNKKVCVINPFIAYPAWPVNGIMVSGPVFEGGDISAYPENLLSRYKFPSLGGIVDWPDEKGLEGFIKKTKIITNELADVSFKIYKDSHPDLFFLTFLTLDRIKHFLWRYTDEGDRFYPGKTRFQETIKEFYLLYDAIIGQFLDNAAEDTTVLLISDHGHRRRCTHLLNLNEILRKRGFISTSANGFSGLLKKVIEKGKVLTVSKLSDYGLQDWIYKIAKFIPNRKSLKKSTYLIDKQRSPVVLSNLFTANPYGGININVSTDTEYEKTRDDIIQELSNLNNVLKADVVKWVKKREDVYKGSNAQRLPDVLFELNDDYGVGRDFYTKPVSLSYTHKKISGGHKKEAVLLVCSDNLSVKNMERPKSVIGLKDYILGIVNI